MSKQFVQDEGQHAKPTARARVLVAAEVPREQVATLLAILEDELAVDDETGSVFHAVGYSAEDSPVSGCDSRV